MKIWKRIFATVLAFTLTVSLAASVRADERVEDMERNHDRLAEYIEEYGEEVEGVKTWLETEVIDGADFTYTLQHTQEGFLMKITGAYQDGSVDMLGILEILLPDNAPEMMFVDAFAGGYMNGVLADSLTVSEQFDRTAFSQDWYYRVTESSAYITADDATELFNQGIQMLCNHWDYRLFEENGFGLRGLGFDAYDGYGCVTHSYTNACDAFCDQCGYIRKPEHSFSNSCDAQCDACSYVRADAGHTFGAYFTENSDTHCRICSGCGFEEQGKHCWDVGVLVQQPTEEEPGLRKYTCQDCGETKTETAYLVTPGDLDGNGQVDESDVLMLIKHILIPEIFKVNQSVDFDGSGAVNEDDALRLLKYIMMPDIFPLK